MQQHSRPATDNHSTVFWFDEKSEFQEHSSLKKNQKLQRVETDTAIITKDSTPKGGGSGE